MFVKHSCTRRKITNSKKLPAISACVVLQVCFYASPSMLHLRRSPVTRPARRDGHDQTEAARESPLLVPGQSAHWSLECDRTLPPLAWMSLAWSAKRTFCCHPINPILPPVSLIRMMEILKGSLDQSMIDGYDGLWATGDMTWEFGPKQDFSKLMEYEWRLEEFMRDNSGLAGICLYRADSLPREAMLQGLVSHETLFINETLSRANPHYVPREFSRKRIDPESRPGIHP